MLQLRIDEITPSNPLVIETPDQLKKIAMQLINGVLGGIGGNILITEEKQLPDTLTTQQAKRLLQDMGYQAKSHVGFVGVMQQYNIEGKKKGRGYVWMRADIINKVPNKAL